MRSWLSLNPYSNGLPSRGYEELRSELIQLGLNPYSNGLPSRGKEGQRCPLYSKGLNPYSNGLPSRGGSPIGWKDQQKIVLIPILMDYPLGVYTALP